jgi:hypothetical protein
MKTLVTGDFILDNHIVKGNRGSTSSPYDAEGTKIVKRFGGACLTYELLKEGLKETLKADIPRRMEKISALEKTISEEKDAEQKSKYQKTLTSLQKELAYIMSIDPEKAICSNLLKNEFETHTETHPEFISNIIWESQSGKSRFTFNPMGYGKPISGKTAGFNFLTPEYSSDLLILDEANLGFRDLDLKLNNETILYNGKLWQNLTEDGHRLIAIVTLENLRKYNVKVSKAISWEQTALDLCYELTSHEILKNLLKCTCLIVLIGSAGALLVQQGHGIINTTFELIFDPVHMEDEWEVEHGTTIGSGSAFIAGFTLQFLKGYHQYQMEDEPKEEQYKPNWFKLIATGLNHVRTVRRIGLFYPNEKGEFQAYPIESMARAGQESPCFFSKAFVPSPYRHNTKPGAWMDADPDYEPEVDISYLKDKSWSILESNYFYTGERANPKLMLALARNIAVRGADTAKYAPVLKYGKFVSLDRREIESVRNLKQLILNHYSNPNANRPLNLAIFGPPGAGKSFAVNQMAKTLFGKDKVEFLEYNLSQFDHPSELIGAYHSIRDAVLQGKFPFAFWDEFDSNNLEWLAHLIAPMQDGRFQEHGKLHPLGKCVFIFAGATSYKMEAFDPAYFNKEAFPVESPKEKEVYDFRMKKGPDFLSRIHGFLDVLGPNRKYMYRPNSQVPVSDDTDLFFPIRRALFMRSAISMEDGAALDIDWGLLSAFLEIGEYKKGSRSMERLLSQLHLMNKDVMVRSNLPSDEVIGINVDYDAFIGLLNKDRKMEQFSETAAVHIHNVWMECQETRSTFFSEYQKLNLEGRRKNIAAALRIREVIGATGKFALAPESSGAEDAAEAFRNHISTDEKNPVNNDLETLANKEHEEWMKESRKEGWHESPAKSGRIDYLKLHDCLIDYKDLPESEKKKDRNTIAKYPDFLKGSGYKIVEKPGT